MMVFAWRSGSGLQGDPNPVGARLEALRERADGMLLLDAVVEDARPRASPLHRYFEWNNTAAADEYRRLQAARVIRSIRVVSAEATEDEPRKVEIAYVAVGRPFEAGSSAYMSTRDAMNDPDLCEQVILQALAMYEGLLARHRELVALREIHQAIERVGARVRARAKKQPAAAAQA